MPSVAALPASQVAIDRAEVKVNIRAHDIPRAMRALELDPEDAKRREITFYDTDRRVLFERGLVLRARKKGDKEESTVKVRPVDVADIYPRAAQLDGFKAELEVGASPAKRVPSAQLDVDVPAGTIDAVAHDEQRIKDLFTKDQRNLAADLTGKVRWRRLESYGPIPAKVWKIEDPALGGHEASVELWMLPRGRRMLEISIKCGLGEIDAARAAMLGYLAGRGLQASQSTRSKTERALEAFDD
jgi:hypothetical protein